MMCAQEYPQCAFLLVASAFFFSHACDINCVSVLFGVLSFRVVLVVLPRILSA